MSQIKKEDDDSLGSDTWLLKSVEMEKDEKPKLSEIQTENEEKNRKWVEKGGRKENSNITWRDMFPQAKVSEKVDNLCVYRCHTCGKVFLARQSLGFHLKKTNHGAANKTEKRMEDLDAYLIKLVQHKCKVCSKLILCDRQMIRMHVVRHKIKTLKEYIDLTKIKKEEEGKGSGRDAWLRDSVKMEEHENPKSFEVKTPCEDNKSEVKLEIKKEGEDEEFGRDAWLRDSVKMEENEKSNSLEVKTDWEDSKSKVKTEIKKEGEDEPFGSDAWLRDSVKMEENIHQYKPFEEYRSKPKPTLKNLQEKENVESRKFMLERKWKEATKDATFSESIGNLCRYKCNVCSKISETRTAFRGHLTRTNHGKVSELDLSSFLVKTVVHKCKICSKELFCDKCLIMKHVKQHKIKSLKEYMEMTGVKYKGTYLEIGRKDVIAQFCQTHAITDNITSNVGNLCIYKCDKCEDFTCRTWGTMNMHAHKMKHGQHMSPTKCITKTTFHKCVLCEKIMLCDHLFIARHLKSHKLNMKEYVQRNKLTVLGDTKDNYLIELKEKIKDIPSIQALPHWTMKSSSLTKDQVTKDVGNISFFKCLLCPKDMLSFGRLRGHCNASHKINYLAFNVKNIVEARYHKCFVCAKIIICDTYLLSKHVYYHKMSYVQYCQKYVLKNGGRVIPSGFEYFKNNQILKSLSTESKTNLSEK